MSEYVQAVRVLTRLLTEHRHLDECLGTDSSPLVQQISYGACRYFFLYSELMDRLLDKPLPEKHTDLKLLIITGLYSIDHLHRPAHASVNQVVEAAIKLKKPWAKGMVNAVMRRYGREGAGPGQPVSEQASLNHPVWLIEQLRQDWPTRPEIFRANNQQAPMTLRVNAARISRQDYMAQLAGEGIDAHEGRLCASAVTLEASLPVHEIPGFDEGMVSIQDEAPQLAAGLLNLFSGARILDACAAPGGKTCHILETADNVSLTALDRDAKRVGYIQENLDRLSLTAKIVCSSLETFETELPYDRILLDVPCSATGIIRRHPDIKLLRTGEDVDKLAGIQRGLLDKAFDLLGPGGELLYSTCSILRCENDQVIADFLERTPGARVNALAPLSSPSALQTPHGLQLLPTMSAHDGFYYASISRDAA